MLVAEGSVAAVFETTLVAALCTGLVWAREKERKVMIKKNVDIICFIVV